MKFVADANTFLSVALGEPDKGWIVQVTTGIDLVAPAVLPYELGNAISGMVKRGTIDAGQVSGIWSLVSGAPVELADVDLAAAVNLAASLCIYAYDACYLQCALQDTRF